MMRPTTLIRPSSEEMFWDKVNKTSGCWIWKGYITKGGYGTLTVNSITTFAHRFSWELHSGLIPFGFYILHNCDNPSCVNPNHLYLGTQADNLADMVQRNRTGWGKIRPGITYENSKLFLYQREQIKDRLRKGENVLSLATEFGVTSSLIYRIRLEAFRRVLPKEGYNGRRKNTKHERYTVSTVQSDNSGKI